MTREQAITECANRAINWQGAQIVYDAAKLDLGRDLGGFSLADLLADNFPSLPMSEIRLLVLTVLR